MNYLWPYVLLVVIHSVFCVKIKPEGTERTIRVDEGASDFNLTCFDHSENITWTYPKNNGSIHTLSYKKENGVHELNLHVSNINYLDTGPYTCSRQKISTGNNNHSAETYIYVYDGENYLAVRDEFNPIYAPENRDLIIPCKPTSPNITVALINMEDNSEIPLDYDPKSGFTLKSPRVRDSKTAECQASASNNSDDVKVVFDVHINSYDPPPKPSIVLVGAEYALAGRPVSLNCSVLLKVGPTVSLNWYLPNPDIANRTNIDIQREYQIPDTGLKVNYKILTFFNLSISDTGSYTCEVKDSHYSFNLVNRTHYLNVYDPSESFLDFTSLSDKTSFTLPTGHSKIVWIFNLTSYPFADVNCTVPMGKVVTTLDSASSDKYQLSFVSSKSKFVKFVANNLDVYDTGTYVFTADNGSQKKTVNITMYIEGPPSTKMSMKNELTLINESSEIECSVVGYPLPKVTWFAAKCVNYPTCDDKMIQLPSDLRNDTSTPPTMISRLQYSSSETTRLTCVATNDNGTSSSSIIFFIADVKDGFNVSVSSDEITVGDDVNITCLASKYIYQNNISWHYNLKPSSSYYSLKNSSGVLIMATKTKFSYGSVINIRNIQKSHSAWFKCTVGSIEQGVRAETIDVVVKDVVQPSFIPPTNLNDSLITVDACKGKYVFNCAAKGVPKPTLTWYKDNKPLILPNIDSDNLFLSPNNQELTIRFTQKEHAGKYKCEAKNKAGLTERSILIVVKASCDGHSSRQQSCSEKLSQWVDSELAFINLQKEAFLEEKIQKLLEKEIEARITHDEAEHALRLKHLNEKHRKEMKILELQEKKFE